MKHLITAFITKNILLVSGAALASTGSALWWLHDTHAAEPIIKNREAILLNREFHKTYSSIQLERDNLKHHRLSRIQVEVSLPPESPRLKELLGSIDSRIADSERKLKVLLEKQSALELQEKGLR